MDRKEVKQLIEKARSLGVKIDEAMVSRFKANALNGGQETYLVRHLQSRIEQKQPKPSPRSAEKVLLEKAKSLGVDVGPYSQLAKRGSVPSSLELRLKHDLANEIADKENEKRKEVTNNG